MWRLEYSKKEMKFLQFLAITYMDIGVRIVTLCPLPFNIHELSSKKPKKRYMKKTSLSSLAGTSLLMRG